MSKGKLKQKLYDAMWHPLFAIVRRIINWITRQFIYVGASSLHQISHLFIPSSPLNSAYCRKLSRQDLENNYGGVEFCLPIDEKVIINGVYLSVLLFKEKQLSFTSDKEEVMKLNSLSNDGETVVLFLGNNEYFEEEESKLRAKWYLLQGKNVLMFNYPGYGDSKGTPSHRTTDKAAHMIYNLVKSAQYTSASGEVLCKLPARPKSDEQIILHGYSLGGGIASRLVGQLKKEQNSYPRLLLDRTFDNIYTIALQFIPESLRKLSIVRQALKEVIEENYDYRSVEFLRKYDKKNLFVIHADFDELMFEDTKRALNRAVEDAEENKKATVVNVKKRHGTEWEEVVGHMQRNHRERLEDLEIFLRIINRGRVEAYTRKEEENSWLSSVKKGISKVLSIFHKDQKD